MSDKGDRRTDPATPGLLMMMIYGKCFVFLHGTELIYELLYWVNNYLITPGQT